MFIFFFNRFPLNTEYVRSGRVSFLLFSDHAVLFFGTYVFLSFTGGWLLCVRFLTSLVFLFLPNDETGV